MPFKFHDDPRRFIIWVSFIPYYSTEFTRYCTKCDRAYKALFRFNGGDYCHSCMEQIFEYKVSTGEVVEHPGTIHRVP